RPRRHRHAADRDAGHRAARHRDAARRRLRGGRLHPQQRPHRTGADHHDHLAFRREAPRACAQPRRGPLSDQAVPGGPAAGGGQGRAQDRRTIMSGAPQQLYAVLVALQADTLLLPNLAVAEVVAPEGLRPLPGAPTWFAGLLNWQGRELPIARFELLNNGAAEPPSRRTRIAVINCVSTCLSAGRYGILAEGYPHLVTLNRSA